MAIVDHMDGDEERKSGDLWQLEGPLTYKPTPYAVCQFCSNSRTVIKLCSFKVAFLFKPPWLPIYSVIFLQEITQRVKPRIIKYGQALRLKAKQELIDKTGK